MDRRKFVKKAVKSSMGIYAATTFDFLGKEPLSGMFSDGNFEEPVVKVVDLNIGEKIDVTLHDGSKCQVKLISLEEVREPVFNTLISTQVKVEIKGMQADLVCNAYRLPTIVGDVQIDVPAVKNFMNDTNYDWWKLDKSARLRLWPAGSSWIKPGTFQYPIKQKWFASQTWFTNEPVSPSVIGKVYYHAGMDIGAVEGLTEVVAATDGRIITLGDEVHGDLHPAGQPRYDVIYIEDIRGWVYRYSHLSTFDPDLRVGGTVKMGQRLGYVGKEGGSGGWTHLHFHIESLQPSGKWAVQDSYPFLWESYIAEYGPKIMPIARPHIKTLPGTSVVLDASRSWAKAGVRSYEWEFMDGTSASGATVKKFYERPGTYCETVKVTDKDGNFSFDFVRVAVFPMSQLDTDEVVVESIPDVHTVYYPTFNIKPGDPVIFQSRNTRRSAKPGGNDLYDFGDGSPKVKVPSNIDSSQHAANGYGTIIHHFQKPGNYIVRVDRIDEETGFVGTQKLHIEVQKST